MLDTLKLLPSDPILGLIEKYKNDSRTTKIDLGVGVYKTSKGETPVLASVKTAEQEIFNLQTSKTYQGLAGDVHFNQLITKLALGDEHPVIKDKRVVTLQTPGGCGALRVGAELIKVASMDRIGALAGNTTIWVSDPTWANHIPLLGNVGFELKTYPYYDYDNHNIQFEAMLGALENAKYGDIVLLHACCHNPSGADFSLKQWRAIGDFMNAKGLIPFVDMAYQGFGANLKEDAQGLRLLASQMPEMLLAISCSKNFGLYRERVGAISVICQNASLAKIAQSHMMSIVRGIYSMPPAHGAAIVSAILSSDALRFAWVNELNQMSARIKKIRVDFCHIMREKYQTDRFDFIETEQGMFSFLGIGIKQVDILATDYAIYMTDNSRISLSGLNSNNLDIFCDSVSKTCL